MLGATVRPDTASCDATTPPGPQDPQASTHREKACRLVSHAESDRSRHRYSLTSERAISALELNTVPRDEDAIQGSRQRNPTSAQLHAIGTRSRDLASPHPCGACPPQAA